MILRPKNEDFLSERVLGSRETYSTFQSRRQKGIGQSSSTITNGVNQETQFQFKVNARQLGQGCFKYQSDIEVTYTLGNGVTTLEHLKNRIGLAQYDINQCITSAGLRINGGDIRNSKPYKEAKYMTKTLDLKEQITQNPSAMYNPLNAYNQAQLVNPIRSSDDALQFSRGLGVVPYTISAIAGNEVTVTWHVAGTLILGGTQWFESAGSALDYPNVDDVQLDLTWGRDFRYALAIEPQAGDDAISVTEANVQFKNFELVTELKTPDMATAKIPSKAYFNDPHVQYRSNRSVVPQINSGATSDWVVVGDLNITQVPSLFVVRAFVEREKDSGYLPEIELPIVEASLTAGGSNQIFASYNHRQLWEVTSRNGFQGRHSDFYSALPNANGSCLIFTPSDLAQGILLASNTARSDTMEFQFKVRNHTENNLTGVQVEVAMVYDYYITMDAQTNEYVTRAATVTVNQLVGGQTQYTNLNFDNHVLGGNAFSRFFRKARNVIRPIRKAVEPFTRDIPGASAVHAVADAVGAGKRKAKPKSKTKGGGIIRTGGARMSKAELAQLI